MSDKPTPAKVNPKFTLAPDEAPREIPVERLKAEIVKVWQGVQSQVMKINNKIQKSS